MKIIFLFYLFIFLLISCNKNNSNERVSENSKKPVKTLNEDDSIEYGKIREIAVKYLNYDFWGARLSTDNKYHNEFFNELWGVIEGSSEKIWIVDTFQINQIQKTNSSYSIYVNFKNALKIDPVFNILEKEATKDEIIIIENNKVVSRNEAHISKKVIMKHIDELSKINSWSEERKNLIVNKISNAFK